MKTYATSICPFSKSNTDQSDEISTLEVMTKKRKYQMSRNLFEVILMNSLFFFFPTKGSKSERASNK